MHILPTFMRPSHGETAHAAAAWERGVCRALEGFHRSTCCAGPGTCAEYSHDQLAHMHAPEPCCRGMCCNSKSLQCCERGLTGVLAAQAQGGAAPGLARARTGRGQQPGGQAGAAAALAHAPGAAPHAAAAQHA